MTDLLSVFSEIINVQNVVETFVLLSMILVTTLLTL